MRGQTQMRFNPHDRRRSVAAPLGIRPRSPTSDYVTEEGDDRYPESRRHSQPTGYETDCTYTGYVDSVLT